MAVTHRDGCQSIASAFALMAYLTSSAQPELDFPTPVRFPQLQLYVIRPTCFRVSTASIDFDSTSATRTSPWLAWDIRVVRAARRDTVGYPPLREFP